MRNDTLETKLERLIRAGGVESIEEMINNEEFPEGFDALHILGKAATNQIKTELNDSKKTALYGYPEASDLYFKRATTYYKTYQAYWEIDITKEDKKILSFRENPYQKIAIEMWLYHFQKRISNCIKHGLIDDVNNYFDDAEKYRNRAQQLEITIPQVCIQILENREILEKKAYKNRVKLLENCAKLHSKTNPKLSLCYLKTAREYAEKLNPIEKKLLDIKLRLKKFLSFLH